MVSRFVMRPFEGQRSSLLIHQMGDDALFVQDDHAFDGIIGRIAKEIVSGCVCRFEV